MLTSSDRLLTTHASLSLSAATDTGSMPTGISAIRRGAGPVRSNTESRLSGVLTTSSRLPSGVSAAGCTWALSKCTKSFVSIVRDTEQAGERAQTDSERT